MGVVGRGANGLSGVIGRLLSFRQTRIGSTRLEAACASVPRCIDSVCRRFGN